MPMMTSRSDQRSPSDLRVSALVSEAVLGEILNDSSADDDVKGTRGDVAKDGEDSDAGFFSDDSPPARASINQQLGGGNRRISRASLRWFQRETEEHAPAGLITGDGKLSDDYILKRQSVNKPATLDSIPLLADLTVDGITRIDGWCMTQMILSGFALMNRQVSELNTINVFPIADGDTGANMKVCLKLPVRNLLLDPADSVLTVVSNLAADVLLNGQGNSGTILSHFFVSLAEEVKDASYGEDFLSVNDFAQCVSRAGEKMSDAMSEVVEGTMISVARDCCSLLKGKAFSDLKHLLKEWNNLAQAELAKTPDQLVVEGVHILEKAGVVDSGAQGFVYIIEGMYLASKGELPEAQDINMFKRVTNADEGGPSIDVDHTVTDSAFQFCTEAVVMLKEGLSKDDAVQAVQKLADEENACDSIACVGAKGIVKLHCHSNQPQIIFDRLAEMSSNPILKKEKVEDMYLERQEMHEAEEIDLSDAKFTIVGLGSIVLSASECPSEIISLPVFIVPSDTQEPIDTRYMDDIETNTAQNRQRHSDTAVRYTTAASNPIQIKIELLAALSHGKPVLVFAFSQDKKVSVQGQNIMAAIDLLTEEQQKMITVYTHGWFLMEAAFMKEAIVCAKRGLTLEECLERVKKYADYGINFVCFTSSESVKKLVAWRPGLFEPGFSIEDGSWAALGPSPELRAGEPWTGHKRAMMSYNHLRTASTYEEAQTIEVKRIKDALLPGQKLAAVRIVAVGRPDYGYNLLRKLNEAEIPLEGKPAVVTAKSIFLAISGWGEMTLSYEIQSDTE